MLLNYQPDPVARELTKAMTTALADGNSSNEISFSISLTQEVFQLGDGLTIPLTGSLKNIGNQQVILNTRFIETIDLVITDKGGKKVISWMEEASLPVPSLPFTRDDFNSLEPGKEFKMDLIVRTELLAHPLRKGQHCVLAVYKNDIAKFAKEYVKLIGGVKRNSFRPGGEIDAWKGEIFSDLECFEVK